MSFNSHRASFQLRPNQAPYDPNLLPKSPQHHQSPLLNPQTVKTPQFQPQHFVPPSSMNNNFLQVGSKPPTNRFSPAQFDKKQESWKNNDMNTAKSMIFTPSSNQGPTNFDESKKNFAGFKRLSTMARTADKNFDDLEDFDQAKNMKSQQNLGNFQEGKAQLFKKYSSGLGDELNTNPRVYQPKQPSVSSSMFFNVGQQSNNVYKSFINPSTSSNSGSDFKKGGGLDFLLKYKEEKKLKQQGNAEIGETKESNSSVKLIDYNKNISNHSDNAHNKLFHEYSAPDLGHALKNQYFEPLRTPVMNKNDSPTNPKSSQYDSPTHTSKNQFQYNNYSSPQQESSSSTFLNKFNSDKASNRFSTTKNFAFEVNPVQNSQGVTGFTPSTAFTKKDKKIDEDSVKIQNTTPNKEKFASPSFFKHRTTKILSEAKTLETLPSPSSPKLMQFNDSTDSPTQFKSTNSDADSNDSIECEEQKIWDLDDFELGDKLGKGAFGDVYIAREKNLGFMCVLKKMSKKRIKQQKREEHVIRELKIQMYLNHKHLTAMYGYFHDKDYIYLILEYLPDGNLSQIKKRKKTSEKQTANILKQVCEGLQFMHKNNIIHRDIKPENIFCNEGCIKLGDFGCSVCTDGMRKTIVSCLEYSSPEQLNGGEYNEKIDIWGIGILAYELLTGRSPYQKEIMNMGQQEVDFGALKFPEELKLSEMSQDFIKSLLNVDPIDRLDIQEALEHKFITSNYESPVPLI